MKICMRSVTIVETDKNISRNSRSRSVKDYIDFRDLYAQGKKSSEQTADINQRIFLKGLKNEVFAQIDCEESKDIIEHLANLKKEDLVEYNYALNFFLYVYATFNSVKSSSFHLNSDTLDILDKIEVAPSPINLEIVPESKIISRLGKLFFDKTSEESYEELSDSIENFTEFIANSDVEAGDIAIIACRLIKVMHIRHLRFLPSNLEQMPEKDQKFLTFWEEILKTFSYTQEHDNLQKVVIRDIAKFFKYIAELKYSGIIDCISIKNEINEKLYKAILGDDDHKFELLENYWDTNNTEIFVETESIKSNLISDNHHKISFEGKNKIISRFSKIFSCFAGKNESLSDELYLKADYDKHHKIKDFITAEFQYIEEFKIEENELSVKLMGEMPSLDKS